MTVRSVSSGSTQWSSLPRYAKGVIVCVCVCFAFAGVLIASIATGPHSVPPAPPLTVSQQWAVPDGQESRQVDPSTVPSVPLLEGAVQQYVAPADLPTDGRVFVYAQFPQGENEVVAHLRRQLPQEGWRILLDEVVPGQGHQFLVISPDGGEGRLTVRALPPGVPGQRSQVAGTLTASDPGDR